MLTTSIRQSAFGNPRAIRGALRRLAALIIALLFWLLMSGGAALAEEEKEAALDPKRLRDDLTSLEAKVKAERIKEEEVGNLIQQATRLRTQSNQCVTNVTEELAPVQASMQNITAGLSEEAQAKNAEIKKLKEQITKIEGRATECRLLVARADEAVRTLAALQQRYLKERLLSRDKNVYDLTIENLSDPGQWWISGKEFVIEHSGIKEIGDKHWIFLALITAFGVFAGRRLKGIVSRRCAVMGEEGFSASLLKGVVLTAGHYTPSLLALAGVDLYLAVLNSGVAPKPFMELLMYGVSAYVVVLMMVRCLLAPAGPAKQVTPWPDEVARRMVVRIRSLLLLLLLGALLILTTLPENLPEHVNAMARVVLVSLLAINAIWLIWILGRIPDLSRFGHGVRFFLSAVLVAVLAAEWLGFRNLSTYLFAGISGTLLAGVLFWLADKLLSEIFDSLDSGAGNGWQRRLRLRLGLKSNEPVPGLIWLRAIAGLLLWGGVALALLRIWGVPDSAVAMIVGYLVDGFQIGETPIVPSKVVLGLLVFALLLTLARWSGSAMCRNQAIRSRLDSGAREALVTIIGYVGFLVALLSGLSFAGVDFSKIALVAGALSVGIGFGLQNIVNNFISGLILLFGRPVRVGDWIVVGNTQGYVRKISVRSTQIQTFDRSDVIVPNGDLISSQVTNWTLRDRQGRIIVPVGVAYGSDTALVKQLLLEAATAHPQVVDSDVIGKPKVLFMAFGDSALLFELRCFIWNIADKLDVISDLNFAIDKAFCEHGIEIPFPKRDLYIRGMEESVQGKSAAEK